MTRAEKEQYVVELYKQNKTIREIAKRTHMSFRDIGIITNKYKKEIELEKGHLEEKADYKPKSKTTQAIEMFSEGKTPTEVVIELDLPADKVRTIYRQYLELNGMYDVLQILPN